MKNYWIEALAVYYKKYFGKTANLIFDVGTRDGDDAITLMHLLKAKEVYAIEARQDAAEQTKQKHPELTVINTAISNWTGNTTFNVIISDDPDYVGSSSIYNNKFERPEYPHKEIVVPVTTMCNVINRNGLSGKVIDIMKVDIEGYTYECLESLHEHYKNVKMFHLETEVHSTHDGHRNNLDVQEFMINNQFTLVAKQYEWGPDIEDQIWVNKRFL